MYEKKNYKKVSFFICFKKSSLVVHTIYKFMIHMSYIFKYFMNFLKSFETT